jgi:hypothetical protein
VSTIFLLGWLCFSPEKEVMRMSLYPSDIKQEAFCSWLCDHEQVVFGHPSGVFDSPLSAWLFEVTGRLYGVDGLTFGLALVDGRYWMPLPQWAKLLMARLDTFYSHPLTGCEVFALLASVEVALMLRLGKFCTA